MPTLIKKMMGLSGAVFNQERQQVGSSFLEAPRDEFNAGSDGEARTSPDKRLVG